MKEIAAYWRNQFDWRRARGGAECFSAVPRVNSATSISTTCTLPVTGPDPMPLLLLHGWPGSIFEFLEIIPRLTDPASFGGDPRDAFTVVAPSLPGYGLSFHPGQKRYGVPEMADCVASLMGDVLGYCSFRRTGRRLGFRGREPPRLCPCRPNDRHSPQFYAGGQPVTRRHSRTRPKRKAVFFANWRTGPAKRSVISGSRARARKRLLSR